MYKTGVVYIWQNIVGAYSCLNGTEVMVTNSTGYPMKTNKGIRTFWLTDTPCPDHSTDLMVAEAGDLREKKPPSGERNIMEMFTKTITKQPELEPA